MGNAIVEFIETRPTVNLFDPSQTVGDDQITELVRLATKAPTSFNLQNWRFVAVRTPEAKARLSKVGWDQPKITDAGVTFIVVGRVADPDTTSDRLKPVVDAGIMSPELAAGWGGAAKFLYQGQPQRSRDEAVRTATFGAMTLILAAHTMGLSSSPMIGFYPEGVTREFGLADDEIPVMLLAVGHATDENWPQKPRRPLAEVLDFV